MKAVTFPPALPVGILSILSLASVAFPFAAIMVAPPLPTFDNCVPIESILLLRTPSSLSRVLTPMKKVPAVETFPLIRSSKVIAREHDTAFILLSRSPALATPVIPAIRVRATATNRVMVGHSN